MSQVEAKLRSNTVTTAQDELPARCNTCGDVGISDVEGFCSTFCQYIWIEQRKYQMRVLEGQ